MIDLTQPFTVKGKWWIYDGVNRDAALPGQLDYSPSNGISLELDGSLLGTRSILHAQPNVRIDHLVGITKENDFITLFNLVGSESGTTEWIITELDAEYATVNNAGYFSLPGMTLHGMNFSTNFFASFFKSYAQHFKMSPREDGVEFRYDDLPPLHVCQSNPEAYFIFSYHFKGLGAVGDEFSFTEKIYKNIFWAEPVGIEEMSKKFRFFRDLFTLFSYKKISIINANVFTRNDQGQQIPFAFVFNANQGYSEDIAGYDVLLRYDELNDALPALFKRWITDEQTIQSGLQLYLQTRYLTFPSPIQRFLNLIFAVETLHNTYFDKPVFAKEEMTRFKKQRDAVLSQFDENFRSRIMDSLSHINALTLKERLKDMIDSNWDLLAEFIYNKEDFCRRVTKQRNYLAHDHSTQNRSVISDQDYFYFTAMLRLIFECCFLAELGLDWQLIKKIIQRHFTYQHFRLKLDDIRKRLIS